MKLAVIAHKSAYAYIFNNVYESNIYNLRQFIDWEKPVSSHYQQIPIIYIGGIDLNILDALLIAVPWEGRVNQLLLWLRAHNVNCPIYVCRPTVVELKRPIFEADGFDERYVDLVSVDDRDKPYLHFIETHVCDDCNLNCKACTHFAPFVKERRKTDIKQFEADLRNLKRLFSHIGSISILGGEALLEPELCCEMTRLSREMFPKSNIEITTNGVLVPKQKESFWKCVKETDAIINVTVYPPTEKMLGTIREVFEQHNIPYDPRMNQMRVETFAKFMTMTGKFDAKRNNDLCAAGGCFQLADGYVGKCPEDFYLDFAKDALQIPPEQIRKKAMVKLSEETDGWEVLRKLSTPGEMCARCNKDGRQDVKWARMERGQDGMPDIADWFL